MKRCPRCAETKPLDQFYRAPENSDGRRTECKACGAAAQRARNRKGGPRDQETGRLVQVTAVCWVCGATFNPFYPGQATCSNACRGQSRRTEWPSRRVYFGKCHGCENWFAAKHPKKQFCSRQCCDRTQRPELHPPAGICKRCGQPSETPFRRCDRCRRERKHASNIRYRATKQGAPSEKITLREIAERDQYRCGLCRKRVNMNLVYPHPGYPTLDHVVPLSEGGEHLRANIQLAHSRCNTAKNNRGSQQLMLIG